MRYDLKEILDLGEAGGFAVPAFNVYNLETVLGVMKAAEETGAPVIFQMYSRLFDSEIAQYVAPIIREAMDNLKTPAAFHLDHGAGVPEVLRAFRYGATGVMIDASKKPIEENIAITRNVVQMA
ncbi:class II fructose-bisphosphate aldolase, partial [bacterium]|nr:class II fructose-bisphosphate aldolase [bacterium]